MANWRASKIHAGWSGEVHQKNNPQIKCPLTFNRYMTDNIKSDTRNTTVGAFRRSHQLSLNREILYQSLQIQRWSHHWFFHDVWHSQIKCPKAVNKVPLKYLGVLDAKREGKQFVAKCYGQNQSSSSENRSTIWLNETYGAEKSENHQYSKASHQPTKLLKWTHYVAIMWKNYEISRFLFFSIFHCNLWQRKLC